MADITKTVSVLFQGTDDISGVLKSISRNTKSFGSDLGSIGDPFAKATQGVLALDAALIALIATGLVVAFKASTDFETSSVKLSKILGDEADQIRAVESATISLSNQYGRSATSILDSTTDFKKAGFAVKDALTLAEESIGLVVAAAEAELDVAESTEIIIASLKGFGAPAKEAARLTDILNTVSNQYATSVLQLGTGLSKLAPIAKLSGLSFEETAAVLTPVIEVFRSGDEAAIALKKGLLSLISSKAPVRAALESIGVSQTDANGALRSGRDILFDVAKAFQTTDNKTKLFVASQLVGIQQAGRMVKVFDSLKKVNEITAVAMGATGSKAKEVAKVLDTSKAAVDRFTAGFQNLNIKVGDQFRDAAKEAIEGGTAIEIALQGIVSSKTFKPVFDAISKFSTDFGADLQKIAKDMPEAFKNVDFNELIGAVGGIGDALDGVFDGIDLSTPEGISKTIQSIVDTLTGLANTTKGVIEVFSPFVKLVIGMTKAFGSLDKSTQEAIGNILALGSSLTAIGGVLGVGGILIGGLSTLAGLLSSGGVLVAGIATVAAALWGLSGSSRGLVAVATAVAGYSLGNVSEEHRKVMEALDKESAAVSVLLGDLAKISTTTATAEVFVLIEEGDLEGARVKIAELTEQDKTATIKVETEQVELNAFFDAYNGIDPDLEVQVTAAINAGDFDKVNEILDGIVDGKEVLITADVTQATETLTFWTESQGEISIEVPVEAEGVDEVIAKVAEIPTEKQIEIKLQGEIDTQIAAINAAADTAQAAFQFTAQVDIANAEASAEILSAAFDAVGESVSALATSTADMFGSVVNQWDNLTKFDQNVLLREVEKQQDVQNKALESQIKLNDATVKNLDAKTSALERGDAAITIDSTGLEPALEMVMWQIIEKVQIRANESASEFLLGV